MSSEIETIELSNHINAEKSKFESSKDILSSEQIFEEIGGFGFYQILVGIASGVGLLLWSLGFFNFIFSTNIPEHRLVWFRTKI